MRHEARRIARCALAACVAVLVLVPLFVIDARDVTAQEGDESDVIVRSSFEVVGDGTGVITIEVEPVNQVAGAAEFLVDYGPGIEPVLDENLQPACEIGSPWAGSCGPVQPTGRVIVAVFAFQPNRLPAPEIVAKIPVLLSGDLESQWWNLEIQGIWDTMGHPLVPTSAIGDDDDGGASFLRITGACDRGVLVVTSDDPVVAASLTPSFGAPTELVLAEVTPGVYEGVPAYWDFESVVVEIEVDGVVTTRQQPFFGTACDADFDEVLDQDDNCPDSFNPSQDDFDDNGIGDSCDGTVVNCSNGLFRIDTGHAPTIEALLAASDASYCWSFGGGGPNFEMSLTLFGLDPQTDIDFSPLTGLVVLEVIDSDLTSVPTGVTSLSDLHGLSLEGNALSSVPADFTRLEHLSTLFLDDNAFNEVPLAVWNLPALRRLDLSGNQISTLPATIGDELQRLDMRDNLLTADLTAFLDAWFAVDRDHLDDADLAIDDGPGGNDCVTTANPEASVVWGVRRIAFECDAELSVEGHVWSPDGFTGVFGAEVCAERPLLETLCVFTDVFGYYRFDDVGQGNMRFVVTDTAGRFEAPPTDFVGLVLTDEPATIDFNTFFVGLGGVEPEPGPTPTPGPTATPGPTPTPNPEPTPEPPAPSNAMVGTISGRYFDDLGAPLLGAQVCAELVFVGTVTCAMTDGTGRFFFGGLLSGNYVVSAYANDEIVDSYAYASVSPTQGVAGIELRDN